MRSWKTLRAVGASLVAVAAVTALPEGSASACGGAFVNPDENDSVVTDHRMILSISQKQTTLYDQIEFTGAASSFAWVLPIKGTVTVGLSADLLFASLDQLTETQVVPPNPNCPPPPTCDNLGFAEGADPSAEADAGAARAGVTVTAQQQVGPYETVQLHSTDPNALSDWLTSHGYAIPASVAPVVAAYVADNFDFLAMKLVPGQGVTAMRPVRVTSQGAAPVLPLRMVSVGTGATTGITLWVIGDSRWQPQNFPFFSISDSEIAWDWATNSSNYDSLRSSKEAALGGRGWEVESSLELAQYTIESTVEQAQEFNSGAAGSSPYLPVGDGGADAAADAAIPDGGPESANQVEQADFDTLFAGISGQNARITRMRSDIAHAALASDLTLEASTDQSELTNVHNPTQQIGQPLCPTYDGECNVTGEAPRDVAVAEAADSGGGGGGCSTSTAHSRFGSRVTLVGVLGFLAFGAFRSRRKRRQH